MIEDQNTDLKFSNSVFWIALLGVFSDAYINRDVSGYGVRRMKNAVLIDLTSLMLWFDSMVLGILSHIHNRGRAMTQPVDENVHE